MLSICHFSSDASRTVDFVARGRDGHSGHGERQERSIEWFFHKVLFGNALFSGCKITRSILRRREGRVKVVLQRTKRVLAPHSPQCVSGKFATCPWPLLCEQSELQCCRPSCGHEKFVHSFNSLLRRLRKKHFRCLLSGRGGIIPCVKPCGASGACVQNITL